MTIMEYVSLGGLFILALVLTYRQIKGKNIGGTTLRGWLSVGFLWVLLFGLVYVQYDRYQKEHATSQIQIQTR